VHWVGINNDDNLQAVALKDPLSAVSTPTGDRDLAGGSGAEPASMQGGHR
jgi:hypothetical protein